MNIHDVFAEKSTQRHDYTLPELAENKRLHQWSRDPKTPQKILRQKPYQPKDIHTMRPWVDPYHKVSYNLLWDRKDITQTHPQEKVIKCTRAEDLQKDEVIKTRPRLYMSPAVSMDDISDKEIRDLLTKYMYSTVFRQATAELNLKVTQREVPDSAFEKCADQVRGTYGTIISIPADCKKRGKAWETHQYTSLVDPDRKYWISYQHQFNTPVGRNPYKGMVPDQICKEIRDLIDKDELRMAYDKVKPGFAGYVPRNVVGPFRKQELQKK